MVGELPRNATGRNTTYAISALFWHILEDRDGPEEQSKIRCMGCLSGAAINNTAVSYLYLWDHSPRTV